MSFRQGLQCVRHAELSLIAEGTVVCVGEVIFFPPLALHNP